ncbi:linker for activation of T-cells family member 2 isoform X2 [Equus asinus]|uniref:linker for activation of T-cells family member 2 isoform X2 n=1 Tax=Equus asinus TaxID=9793 RepID=UPI0038F5F98E
MSTETETELLWPGAALLLLLGAVAGLCMRCSRPGTKRSEKIYQQRSLHENQQSFAVARTYSLVRQAWPGPLADTASDVEPARKDKLLRFSPSLEDPASARYQDFSKGSRHGTDAAYIDPITMECYNWGWFQKPPADDDDTNSYENVLICKQTTESGEAASPAPGQEPGLLPACTGDMLKGIARLEARKVHRCLGAFGGRPARGPGRLSGGQGTLLA